MTGKETILSSGQSRKGWSITLSASENGENFILNISSANTQNTPYDQSIGESMARSVNLQCRS
jgi:hypothetical protein